jgi:hypothetical protein
MDFSIRGQLDDEISSIAGRALRRFVRDIFDQIAERKKLSAVRALRDEFEDTAYDVAEDLAFDVLQQVEHQLAEAASRNRSTDMAGPTFVARFADGQETKMSIYAPHNKLDVGRGVRLAQHAYRSRMKAEPPALLEAHFEREGQVLRRCNPDELNVPTAL